MYVGKWNLLKFSEIPHMYVFCKTVLKLFTCDVSVYPESYFIKSCPAKNLHYTVACKYLISYYYQNTICSSLAFHNACC